MSARRFDTKALRRLAEDVFHRLAVSGELHESQQADYVTSLVRQWTTYDGCAVLFLADRPVYFALDRTPLGKPTVTFDAGLGGWLSVLTDDWRIDENELPEIVDQLNRGQSVEVANGDGISLRLWLNPKQRTQGVEPLDAPQPPPGAQRDYRKIARHGVRQQLEELDAEELEAPADSIAQQWQTFDGHASIFVNGREQLLYRITENDVGECQVKVVRQPIDLDAALANFGFSPDAFPELIARINLGQVLEIQNSISGVRSRLWHDPKASRFVIQPVDPERTADEGLDGR